MAQREREADRAADEDQGDEIDLDGILRELEAEFDTTIENPEVGRLMQSLLNGMDALGWEYRFHRVDYVVVTMKPSPRTQYHIALFADEAVGVIGARTSAAFRVPDDKRAAACEVVNRANWGLRIGNFEMDMDDGEVVFRVGLDHEDSEVSARLVRQVIQASLGTFERYVPAFLAIIEGNATPARAIQEVENR